MRPLLREVVYEPSLNGRGIQRASSVVTSRHVSLLDLNEIQFKFTTVVSA